MTVIRENAADASRGKEDSFRPRARQKCFQLILAPQIEFTMRRGSQCDVLAFQAPQQRGAHQAAMTRNPDALS